MEGCGEEGVIGAGVLVKRMEYIADEQRRSV